MKKRILFLCLGNICRSPAAEEIFRHYVHARGLDSELEIDSAGTYGGHAGELPDGRMRQAAALRGYHLTHRSRLFRTSDFDNFDMILTMDDRINQTAHDMASTREDSRKIFRMTDFCTRQPHHNHIPDPYYEGHQGFEIVLDLLEDGCEGLLLSHVQNSLPSAQNPHFEV